MGYSGEDAHMRQELTELSRQVASLVTTQSLNHAQNRRDIHDLRNGQQVYIDRLQVGFDKLADKIADRVAPLEEMVMDLRLKWAKAVGYGSGMAALGAVVFEVVKSIIEKASK